MTDYNFLLFAPCGNTKPCGSSRRAWKLVAIALLSCAALAAPNKALRAANDLVTIVFKEEATAPGSVVLLRDIAEIECDSEVARAKWESLDLDEGDDGDVKTIHRTRAQLRAKLAGMEIDHVRWRGAPKCEVTVKSSASRDSYVTEAITKAAALALNLSPEDLKVTLTWPVEWRGAAEQRSAPDDVRVEAILPDAPRPGANNAKLSMYIDDELVASSHASYQLGLFEYVPRALRAIPRGQTITSNDIVSERILRVIPGASLASDQVIGQVAATTIASGQIVRERDVRKETMRRETVIQGRQPVRVIVRKGNLEVRMTGAESLESGGVGDWIRVRNPQSNRIVRGQIREDHTVVLE